MVTMPAFPLIRSRRLELSGLDMTTCVDCPNSSALSPRRVRDSHTLNSAEFMSLDGGQGSNQGDLILFCWGF